jgi:hypothetical protein
VLYGPWGILMADGDLVLDLRWPKRTVLFILACCGVVWVPACIGLFSGWYQETNERVIAGVVALVFVGLPILMLQERVQISRTSIRTRSFGYWRRRDLPQVVAFKRMPDLNGAARMARGWLDAPPNILIWDVAANRLVDYVRSEMLAGMSEADYERLLERLNRGAAHA